MTASNLAIVVGPNLLWSRDMAANLASQFDCSCSSCSCSSVPTPHTHPPPLSPHSTHSTHFNPCLCDLCNQPWARSTSSPSMPSSKRNSSSNNNNNNNISSSSDWKKNSERRSKKQKHNKSKTRLCFSDCFMCRQINLAPHKKLKGIGGGQRGNKQAQPLFLLILLRLWSARQAKPRFVAQAHRQLL